MFKKILLIIFDGLSDRPVPELGGKTPLEVAKIPNLDEFAASGVTGVQNALPMDEYPTSEDSHFAIFGYDPKEDMPGRGVLEAIGLGVELEKKDLVLRVDFGTVDESFTVIDPRAGNIKSVDKICEFIGEQRIGPFTFKIYPGLGHRAALIIEGAPVSKEIKHHSTIVSDTDPHKAKVHRGDTKVLIPEAIENTTEAKMTAEALWSYQLKTHQMLNQYVENKVKKRSGLSPANFILTRGAGFLKKVEPFREKFNLHAACVAGAPLYKGIGKYLGMDVVSIPGATGGIDTDISAKLAKSIELLEGGYDFVFMHLKGSDVVAEEEGSWQKKIEFFEKADRAFEPLIDFDGILCVTGDHSTPCILKDHSTDPVPIMIIGSKKSDLKRSDFGASLRSDLGKPGFNEVDCAAGSLGHLNGAEIMPKLIKESK